MRTSPRTGELLDRGLRMFVQPVVDLHSGEVTRVEGLARLGLDDGTIVPPRFFVPDLSPSELDALFRFGLGGLLRAVAEWERAGIEIGVGLNLPPATLRHPDVVGWVEDALAEHGVAAGRLVLELLEDQIVDSADQHEAITGLRSLGVHLVMDDLGRGYSDLRRLDALRFDGVKIDQLLVRSLASSPIDALPVVAPLIDAGLQRGCRVVVEGLESWPLVEAARVLGATRGQGHAVAAPMPSEDFVRWWRDWSPSMPGCDRLESALGALCFQWSRHVRGHGHEGPADACPLSPRLESSPETVRDAHAGLHSSHLETAGSAAVLEWLIHAFEASAAA